MPQMIRGGDPAVLKIADNNYLIIYVSAPTAQMMTSVSEKYEGLQVSPNPASELIRIRFTLPTSERVSLTVFNMLGQVVAQVIDEILPAGEYNQSLETRHWLFGNQTLFLQLKTSSQKLQTIPIHLVR